MTSDDRGSGQARLARVLSAVGGAWFALFVLSNLFRAGGTPLGEILAFFGGSLFIPIALIFAGRALRRRSGPASRAPAPQPPRPAQRPTPTAQRRPEPTPPKPAPSPRTERTTEKRREIEALLADGQEAGSGTDRPLSIEPPTAEPGYTPKTSAEMIAEARKKLDRRP